MRGLIFGLEELIGPSWGPCPQAFLFARNAVLGVEDASAPKEPIPIPHNTRRCCEANGERGNRVSEFWPDQRRIGARLARIVLLRAALLTISLTAAPKRAHLGGSSGCRATACSIGSRGRTRTYNPSVNSRLLYH